MSHESESDHHAGLAHDLELLAARLNRRRVLEWLACMGATALGCSGNTGDGDTGASASDLEGDGSCGAIPQETQGPYPGDGTNGPNALALSGIVRSDIRSSIAGATGVAAGVPLTLRLRLLDTTCTPLPGFAVYLWHCDQVGRYSMYSAGATEENYLRGVQEADEDGVVTFTTIFPGCYSGRWPHIHFEIYESLAAASSANNVVKTSQLALPESACDEVYATSGYEASVTNLSRISLSSDNVFSDGVTLQLASITGDVDSGFVATLDVALAI
jgi:protocatechuate 3,4-dioxygenase beta subunit